MTEIFTMDISKLLALSTKDLREHLEYTHFLQENIRHYIQIHDLTKKQIMDHCELSEAQYYRNMNNSTRWDIDTLIKVVELAEMTRPKSKRK
jgi:hypothetical protein